MTTQVSCGKCGRTFKGATGLAWHDAHPATCTGAAKQPSKLQGKRNDWHPGVTCEQAHPGVGHIRGMLRCDSMHDCSHESYAAVVAHVFPGAAPAAAKPVRTSKGKARKLAKQAAAANAANGAHDVHPHRGVRGHGRPTGGRVHAASMPADWMNDKNGKPLHGAALAKRAAKREAQAPADTATRVAALIAEIDVLLASARIAA